MIAVFRGMNPKNSPGENGFTSDICSKAMLIRPDLILSTFNVCLRLCYFPHIWKRPVIRIIPKPGKDSYQKPKSFKPIGLLPVLGKVLEKLFATRLLWELGSTAKLSSRQLRFMPQRSTEVALYGAMNRIQAKREKCRYLPRYRGGI